MLNGCRSAILIAAICAVQLSTRGQPASPNVECGPPLSIPDCTPTLACSAQQDQRSCNICVANPFGGCIARYNDPMCEAAKAAQNTSYSASKLACEASKSNQLAQCEATKQSLIRLNSQIAAACQRSGPARPQFNARARPRPSNNDTTARTR